MMFSLRTSLFLCFVLVSLTTQAQQVLVLCEGAQDFTSGEVIESPRLGRFDAAVEMPEFEVLHVFEGHAFAVDLALSADGLEAYVSAEDTVYRMDLSTGQVLAQQAVEGARQVLLHEDRVFVTRGDYDPETFGSVDFDAFLVALDATTLGWEADWASDALIGPAFASEAMAVVDGVLHIGINNAFAWGAEVGIVGRLDLETGAYDEVDLGPEGLNPVHLINMGDAVVTVNARQYEATSLSRLTTGTDAVTATVAETTAGCGAAARLGDNVVFQVYGEGDFRIADGVGLTNVGSWPGNGMSVYSMAVAEDGRFFLGNTDFVSSGDVEVRAADGTWLASVNTGVAPGRIVMAPVSSSVEAMVPAASTSEVVSRCDMMGRPVEAGQAGLQLVRLADGRVLKVYQAH